MSYLNRAWLYITRKKVKTLIMLLVLILMSTAILSGLAVKTSMRKSAEALTNHICGSYPQKRHQVYIRSGERSRNRN